MRRLLAALATWLYLVIDGATPAAKKRAALFGDHRLNGES